MIIKDFLSILEQKYPLAYQEPYDNSGSQILFIEKEIQGILLCLDITETVIDEAIKKNCNLIISHHPVFFKPINSIIAGNKKSNIIIKAIQHQISLYALHTNFDSSWEGSNRILADLLHLQNLEILDLSENKLKKLVTFVPNSHADKVRIALFEAGAGHIGNYDACSYNIEGFGTFRGNEESNPFVGEKGAIHKEPEIRVETIFPAYLESTIIQSLIDAHPYEEVAYDIYPLSNKHTHLGIGMIGYLSDPMSTDSFLWYVKEKLAASVLKYNHTSKKIIQKIAICSGSGHSLISKAIQRKADAYITSDLTYHHFTDSPSDILLIDAGHYETEIHFVKKIFEFITKKNTNFAVYLSENCLNPVNYF